MNEGLRTYTRADLARATRRVDHDRRQGLQYDDLHPALAYPSNWILARRAAAIPVAEQMEAANNNWVEATLGPLRPYLHSEGTRRTDDLAVKRHFYEGVQGAVSVRSITSPNKLDLQDVIAGFAGTFFGMIRACEQMGIHPDAAIELAEKSYRIKPEDVENLLATNTDLPTRVVERAATSFDDEHTPVGFLEKYRRKASLVDSLAKHYDYPTELLAEAVQRNMTPDDVMMMRRRIANAPDIDFRADPVVHVDGLNKIRQRHGNWCGLSVLSMSADTLGYPELTPEALFRREYGYYDPILEDMDPVEGPALSTLAILAEELTPLRARVLTTKSYAQLRENNPRLKTPHDVLQKLLYQGPAILRTTAHYLLATGYDAAKYKYSVFDPLTGKEEFYGQDRLDALWGKQSYYAYNGDTRYLMMTLRQRK